METIDWWKNVKISTANDTINILIIDDGIKLQIKNGEIKQTESELQFDNYIITTIHIAYLHAVLKPTLICKLKIYAYKLLCSTFLNKRRDVYVYVILRMLDIPSVYINDLVNMSIIPKWIKRMQYRCNIKRINNGNGYTKYEQ